MNGALAYPPSTRRGFDFSRQLPWALLWALLAAALPVAGQPGVFLSPTNTSWSIWTNGTNPGYGPIPGAPEWAQPSFDDREWPTGRGLFGNDSGYPYPFQTITPPASVVSRFYGRVHFRWEAGTHGVRLRGTNFIDDGAVVYLNGIEIYRFNMPDGPTTFETLAVNATAEPGVVPVRVNLDFLTNGNANPLRVGDNTIAVETSSNTRTSSDTVWGMTLFVEPIVDCIPSAVIVPAHTNVLECRNVTLVATFPYLCLETPKLQWFRVIDSGEQLLAGETGPSLTLISVGEADMGTYYVKMTTSDGVLASTASILTITPDVVGPQIAGAGLQWEPARVVVTFDGPFLPAASGGTADDPQAWRILSSDGEVLPVVSARSVGGEPPQVELEIGAALIPGRTYTYETRLPIQDVCPGAVTPSGQTGPIWPPPLPRLQIAYLGSGGARLTWEPAKGVRLYSSSKIGGVFEAVPGDPQGSHLVSMAEAGPVAFFRLGY